MTRKEYMARFSLAARWSLSRAEAVEAVSDYEELFAESSQGEPDTCDALGDPVKAAFLLHNPKAYQKWIAAFCLMALCAGFPVIRLFHFTYIFSYQISLLLGFSGMLTAMVWFRRGGSRERPPLPKRLLPTMGGLLAAAAITGGLIAYLIHTLSGPQSGIQYLGTLVSCCLQGMGLLSFLASLTGLVLGRLSDRRWRAVYVLGLDLLLVCCTVLAFLRSMDLNLPPSVQLFRIAVAGLLGLALSGVSLC